MNSYPHFTLPQEICIEVESDKQLHTSFADSAEPYSPIDDKAEKDIDMEGVGVSSRILRVQD